MSTPNTYVLWNNEYEYQQQQQQQQNIHVYIYVYYVDTPFVWSYVMLKIE